MLIDMALGFLEQQIVDCARERKEIESNMLHVRDEFAKSILNSDINETIKQTNNIPNSQWVNDSVTEETTDIETKGGSFFDRLIQML